MFRSIDFILGIYFSMVIMSFQITHAQTINVASSSELRAALDSSLGGTTIRLAAADYGNFDFHDYNFSDYVVVQSASVSQRARFGNIDIDNTSYLRFENLYVKVDGREGVGIFNRSHHIDVVGLTIEGGNQFDRSSPSYTQISTLYGINTNGDVRSIRVENNQVTDVKSSAYLFTQMSSSLVKGNDCDWVASDCYKLAGVDGLLFENNFGARNIFASPTAHIDFVQGQGEVSNSIFRGNVALSHSPNAGFQGLFFDDARFTNLTFENNIIATTFIRGISVSSPSSGPPSSGIIARNNTIIRVAGTQKATLILLPDGSVNEFNFVSNNVTKNADRFPSSNIIGQWDDPDDIAHYDLYYVNADKGFGLTVEDLQPVNGSPTQDSVGAYQRISQLLNLSDRPNTDAVLVPIIMILDQ